VGEKKGGFTPIGQAERGVYSSWRDNLQSFEGARRSCINSTKKKKTHEMHEFRTIKRGGLLKSKCHLENGENVKWGRSVIGEWYRGQSLHHSKPK